MLPPPHRAPPAPRTAAEPLPRAPVLPPCSWHCRLLLGAHKVFGVLPLRVCCFPVLWVFSVCVSVAVWLIVELGSRLRPSLGCFYWTSRPSLDEDSSASALAACDRGQLYLAAWQMFRAVVVQVMVIFHHAGFREQLRARQLLSSRRRRKRRSSRVVIQMIGTLLLQRQQQKGELSVVESQQLFRSVTGPAHPSLLRGPPPPPLRRSSRPHCQPVATPTPPAATARSGRKRPRAEPQKQQQPRQRQ
ncbi:hypothetical protein PAHAL_4G195700 [Panicum hallii]|uniref:Uncharacterized protein n=1 Tax=Panicum hallii TaxID=206008 RepID=A0A2T8JDE9_9POAL|nr:uncharacterized protein LOC112890230 [Panicum hallii]PVH47946.1 hypothetical protein PAHAL_4G195700 [Panicum hallii]